ncbi:MAG: Fic family protein [Nanoarchaeota archaeon]
MVYIYKKPIGSKVYYYLRASERKGKKVVAKDIAYLGSTIEEVKKVLDNPKYNDKIRKAYKTINYFLESNHFLEKARALKLKKDKFLKNKTDEVEACRMHYTQVFKKLDNLTINDIFKNYIIEFAYNTASIEGNTISLEEAKNLLNEGITPKDKTLREIYDLQNTEKVFFNILNFKKNAPLNHDFIISIHDNLLENIDARKGYRTTDIHVVKSNFDATPGKYVKTDMNILLDWYDKNKCTLHPLVLAIVFHHKFEKIHPFMDGNGRTGRMIMNYILLYNHLPPIIIHKKTRKEYLEAMREADESELWKIDYEKYKELIYYEIDEFIVTYWNLFL